MLLGAVGVIEFRGQDKSMFSPRKVFREQIRSPVGKEEDFSPEPVRLDLAGAIRTWEYFRA